ncbi:hypothetical protein RSOLAG1IB_12143 [Rhizoctonia solani AG-1 IB]|uniref:Reverse transcriptase domain-containing protein n=1 Tax=Thanatephorus cucumeris (strain AG1-IB / isolate 7/3/14) TaxID=1108050 RepID=A0A0B7FQU7_THACB|nr:hypothetical protein RSOLAG1IB_12143 [Rhizoctonia solani AG-1 IB]
MEQNSVTDSIAQVDATTTHALTPPMYAPSVVAPSTEPNPAPRIICPPVSLLPAVWETELRDLGLLEEFGDVPSGLRDGFRIGAAGPVTKTFIPNNHGSARSNPHVIREHICTELATGRYCGPFDKDTLEQIIGPFSAAPLGVVDKPSTPGKFRIIQDFSYPRTYPSSSLNSQINSSNFPCTWGFFPDVLKVLLDAPPGTKAATFDVDAAYRQMPIHTDDLPHIIVHWDNQCYVDFRVPFGAGSSNGIFARCGDSMALMYARRGFGHILKWVDDFLFIQFPPNSSGGVNPEIFSSVDAIYKFADRLGWPWKRSKTAPFDSVFTYLGFLWDISARRVSIPCKKREKYHARIQSWLSSPKVTLRDTQTLIGSLVHCALVVPEGRPKLAGLIAFSASFSHAYSQRFIRKSPDQRALESVQWWLRTLQIKGVGCQIQSPPPPARLEIFTDASTSHGLGVIIGSEWGAWGLKDGWKKHGRDIGWAEVIAVELAVIWLIQIGHHNTSITINCDNQGVVYAWKASRSRNSQQNGAIERIMAQCMAHDIWLSLEYINTNLNPADRPSRGKEPVGQYTRAWHPLDIPSHLNDFISHNILP